MGKKQNQSLPTTQQIIRVNSVHVCVVLAKKYLAQSDRFKENLES